MSDAAHDWPKELPRFAESFRVFIDHPTHDTRLLTSEWEMDGMFARCAADFCPLLAKAGRLGFIACTVPALEHGHEREYYGTENPPTVYWHWAGGKWVAQTTAEGIAEYCARRKVPVALFDVPRSQEWRR